MNNQLPIDQQQLSQFQDVISQLQMDNAVLQQQLQAANDQHSQQQTRLRMQLETERRLAREAIAALETQLGEHQRLKAAEGLNDDGEEADMTTTKLQLTLLEENAQLRQTLLESVNRLAEMTQISSTIASSFQLNHNTNQTSDSATILTGLDDEDEEGVGVGVGVDVKSKQQSTKPPDLSLLIQSTDGDSTALQVRLKTAIEAVQLIFNDNETLRDRLQHAEHCQRLLQLDHVEREKQWQHEKQSLLLQLQSQVGGSRQQEAGWKLKYEELMARFDAINRQLLAQADEHRQQLLNKTGDIQLLREQQTLLQKELEDCMRQLQVEKQQAHDAGVERDRLAKDLLKAGDLNRQLRLAVKANEETFRAAIERLSDGSLLADDEDTRGLEELEYLWQRSGDLSSVEPLIIAMKAQLTHYKQQLVNFRQQCADLETRIEHLKRNHQTELNELKLTWRPLEQFQTLEQQLDDSEVAARQLRQQHDTDAGTIRQLREQSKEKSEIIESLQAELDANKNASKLTNKNLSRKDLLLQQTKTKLQQIEEQHEQVCSTLAATQEKLKQTQQQLSDKEYSMIEQQKQLQKAKDQLLARLNQQPNPEKLTEMVEQISLLRKELSLKSQRISSINQQLKSLLEENRSMKKEVGELRDETTRLRGELERAESRLQIVSRDRKELASRLAMIKSATPPASAQRPLFPVEVNQTNINADPIYRKADDIARTIFNMSLAEILS